MSLSLDEIEALEHSLPPRLCESCAADIGHKRKDARFCDRNCKMTAWHQANRATPEGRARERVRNRRRYAAEASHRRAGAIAYYWRERPGRLEYARAYRAEHPERRRAADDRRAERARTNPGYCPFSSREWERLKARFGNRCAYCGAAEPMQRDHVIPLSRGGRHAIANILPACASCNSSKSDSLLMEWRLRLERG